ncbi:MAG: Fic family protein, partial [Bacillota bacterium]|nr:Fic family protein [Bacillota bacterium]
MDSVTQALTDLDRRKRALDGRRPLPPETARSLKEALRVEQTYASNAIEGNTLTL